MLTRFDVPISFTTYSANTHEEATEEAKKLLREIRAKVSTKFIVGVVGIPLNMGRIDGIAPTGL